MHDNRKEEILEYLRSKENSKCGLDEYVPPEPQAKTKKELKKKLRRKPKNVDWNR